MAARAQIRLQGVSRDDGKGLARGQYQNLETVGVQDRHVRQLLGRQQFGGEPDRTEDLAQHLRRRRAPLRRQSRLIQYGYRSTTAVAGWFSGPGIFVRGFGRNKENEKDQDGFPHDGRPSPIKAAPTSSPREDRRFRQLLACRQYPPGRLRFPVHVASIIEPPPRLTRGPSSHRPVGWGERRASARPVSLVSASTRAAGAAGSPVSQAGGNPRSSRCRLAVSQVFRTHNGRAIMARQKISRREFNRTGAVAVAGLTALQTTRAQGANNRIRLGFLGVANRGGQLISAFQKHDDMEIVAICDVSKSKLEAVSKQLEGRAEKYEDFRHLLDRPDVQGIVIATPDHWHAIQTIQACQREKDVYVEKPVSLTVREGRAMVNAVHKYDRIVQVGTHRRSGKLYAEAAALVQSGKLGK
ncbi:MAG: Gfo/Idh/MocA family oxidoreductase, partial [Planctomycetes bacterium]|nr:Gfo/Idh/MocA family oxidoreductase [Planctomycetota bacterium]